MRVRRLTRGASAEPAEPHPSGSWRPLWGVALLCYLPFLLTRPGWVSADTKTYLYLDPSRLLSRAWKLWDPAVGMGTVSHQTIGYLWPMGPWFWLFDKLGVPDWVAQRLWWGTLLFAAVAGMAFLLRRFRLPAVAVWPAALAYGLTPYSVAYLGRLSGVLLPAIGLPWLLGLVILAIRRPGWRYPALFALVVTTVGSVNLTALALVGVAPLLWVGWAVLAREAPPRQVAAAVGRIGVLSILTSAWWMAGLSIQASHGIDIVRYSESAEVVSRTSTSFEVLRGLGYWFFYGGDKLDLWVEPSWQYTQRWLIFAISFVVPVIALASGAVGRWRHRTFFATLLVVGALLSIGAHPWDDPSVLGRMIQAFLDTKRGLAFRSLPRAVPLIALAAAALIAGAIGCLDGRHRRAARALGAVVAVAAVAGMVPLWQRSIVQDSLSRREVPDYWKRAAKLLDQRDDGTRVLEVPGADFASYRWGNTVDPITPGLMDRPYVARELVPYGTPPSADLLNDFDLLLQERTLDPQAVAPMARLMRVGDIVVRGDLQYERYALARPKLVWNLFRSAPGLGEPVPLTRPVPNVPDGPVQMQDETWLLQESGLPDSPAVAIVPVEDSRPVVDAKPAADGLVVAGDGAGLVDAAAAGLIDGTELIRYSASLTAAQIGEEVDRGAGLLVTDTNRDRGERWGSLRHTRGYTEQAGEEPLQPSLTDNRLPRFPDRGDDVRSVTVLRGGVEAAATSYGNPITFAADERATLAIDGDPNTAWSTASFSDARGEQLVITLDHPLRLDHLVLQQLDEDRTTRALTKVSVAFDDGPPVEVDLGPESRVAPGQRVDVGDRTTSKVTITLLADNLGNPQHYDDAGPVGFAEVTLGDHSPVVDEAVRLPEDLTTALAADPAAARTVPLAYLLTRIRQDPTDRTRGDEERAMVRLFDVPADRSFQLAGTARVSARADGPTLDQVLGTTTPGLRVQASRRVAGARAERASAALDGDPTTTWTGPYARTTDQTLAVITDQPHRYDHLDLQVVADGRHSVPTHLQVKLDGQVIAERDLPAVPDGDQPGHTVAMPVDLPPSTGRLLELTVTAVRPVSSIDWTSTKPIDHPYAIAELGIDGLRVPKAPTTFDDRCRTDLVTLDGQPLGVRITGTTADAVAGRDLSVATCDDAALALGAGQHELRAQPGVYTGIDLDQLVLRSSARPKLAASAPPADVEVRDRGGDRMRVTLQGLEPGTPVWLILGQSYSDGWQAVQQGGHDLGRPQLVDGFANGWLVTPTTDTVTVDLAFTPQRRVDVALVVSALGIVACLGLAFRRPRPDDPARPGEGCRAEVGGPVSLPVALGVAAGVAVASAVVAHPAVALSLGVAAGLALRHDRFRRALHLVPAGLLGLAVLWGTGLLIRYHIAPGIEWVSEMERLHPLGLAAILALGVDVVVDVVWRRGVD